MSELSIRINIAGRTYPLKIQRDQEESLRRVAKEIDVHISKLKKSYAVKDNQDLLAMTLLEYGTRLDQKKKEDGAEMSQEILSDIENYIDDLNK